MRLLTNPITRPVFLIALGCSLAFHNAPIGAEGDEEVATRLRVVAQIAGSDELRISHRKAVWKHGSQSHILNPKASKIGWKSSVVMRDGSPLPKYPLTQEARDRLGKLTDTLLLTASCELDKPVTYTIAPATFTPAKSRHVQTRVPAYMQWRVAAYLSKAERSLAGIAAVREQPISPKYTVHLRWWLNYGAVGGRGAITMPLRNMVNDHSWFTHPWAISHELLHGFGFGHTWQMDRVDHFVQDRFRYFRWYVADHPEFVPKEWPPPSDNVPTASSLPK